MTNCDLQAIQYLALFCKHLPPGRAPTRSEAARAQKITEQTMKMYKIELTECNCKENHETV